MKITTKQSPNQNDRKDGMNPYLLILHYTGTKTAEEADAIYMTPDRVSPHYMIDRNGSIISYVDEKKRSWHAGKSSWNGETDINSASIGIEIVNGGHEHELEEFPAVQIEKLIELINGIRSRWDIADHHVLGHSDIAPGRKIDPGEKFPWDLLHNSGIGLMPEKGGLLEMTIAEGLQKFGYDYSDDIDLLIIEFSRHYLADQFGIASDDDIKEALASLLAQKNGIS